MSAGEIEAYFAGKPETLALFDVIARRIREQGPSQMTVGSQISFGADRKFAWFWLYNVTRRNPSGVLHLMLALDAHIDDPHVREVTRVGNSRWNHQIVIRTEGDAKSRWLGELVQRAYRYGTHQ